MDLRKAPTSTHTLRVSRDTSTVKGIDEAESELAIVALHRDGAKTIRAVEGTELIVGRAHPANMIVPDPSLSRTHARVVVSRLELRVYDLGSTNGTWVEGRRVEEARVGPGEPVRLGNVTLTLQPSARAASGIDGYDRFASWLAQEVARARTFGRSLALLGVAVRGQREAPTDGWRRVRASLRPLVDRVGSYSPSEILVGLPETSRERAEAVAAQIASENPALRVHTMLYPDDGTSAEELLSNVRDGRRGPLSRPSARQAPLGDEMLRVYAEVARVATTVLPVLILGETGVGKERLAREVHDRSPRAGGPFIAFNCASVPRTLVESVLFGHERGAFTGADRATRGIFEMAHHGTLFLDEVGELGESAQAALLRVLETKRLTRIGSEREITVDVRIVAATHRDLDAMVAAGQFRQDLLFRLEAVAVRIPPLRARPSELSGLIDLFLQEANAVNGRCVTGFSQEAMDAMERHSWPGNVRELKNAVLRAAVIASADRIELEDLPERVRSSPREPEPPATEPELEVNEPTEPPPPPSEPPTIPPAAAVPTMPAPSLEGDLEYRERVRIETQRYERALIIEALRQHNGNQRAVAAALKIPVRTLTHKLKELNIRKIF